jgi:GNAT superfamily N-acetyltransferase
VRRRLDAETAGLTPIGVIRMLAGMRAAKWTVRRLDSLGDGEIEGLARVLVDCVEGGASVSFMQPFSLERAVEFYRGVARGVAGERVVIAGEDELGMCGTVQLLLAQPENQPHRADLAKMLVCRRARRTGLGGALLAAAEAAARDAGKTLLVLDTASADAERLYERAGWVRVGVIPGYALLPEGGLCDTTVYYRELGEKSPPPPRPHDSRR